MKRDKKIDVMKGILILLMVLGHSGFQYDKFICLFHMPVFFMISGFLHSYKADGTVRSLGLYTLKKIKSIWLPYFIWNLIFSVFNNLFLDIHIYANENIGVDGIVPHDYWTVTEVFKNIVKGVFMLGRTELGGAFWFLRTLFYVTIFFACVEWVGNKWFQNEKIVLWVQGAVATVFLLLSYLANVYGLKNLTIPVICVCYFLYYLGRIIKVFNINKYITAVAVIICIIVLSIACLGNGISLGNNEYGIPLYLLICSLAGWGMMYGCAGLILKTPISKGIEYWGENTLPIVILHFVAFKVVSLIQILLYGYPIEYLAAFPTLKADGCWWILYTMVGVLIPLLLNWGYKQGTLNMSKLFRKDEKERGGKKT